MKVRRWLAFLALVGCGRDVDLGGTSPDAGSRHADCEPCIDASECLPGSTCAPLGGPERFCLRSCADGACSEATCTAGVCAPKSGTCEALPPPRVDGGPLERCGADVGPMIAASCHACEPTSRRCQSNGCYGGYWCDTVTRRCEKPPSTCASS